MNKQEVAAELVKVAKSLVSEKKRKADFGDVQVFVNTFNDIFDVPRGMDDRTLLDCMAVAEKIAASESDRLVKAVRAGVKKDWRYPELMKKGIAVRG